MRKRTFVCADTSCSRYLIDSHFGQRFFCSNACRQRAYRARKKGSKLRGYAKSVTPFQA